MIKWDIYCGGLNQRHQDSPLVMLEHPPQDSINFAVHSRRVLKVQNGRKLAQKTNRLRLAELSSQEESDASDPHLRQLGAFKVVGGACGAVVGAVCGAVRGVAYGVVAGASQIEKNKPGKALVEFVGGPIYHSGYSAYKGGKAGAKLGGKLDRNIGRQAGRIKEKVQGMRSRPKPALLPALQL
ncbi:hypothetical protein Ae201684P_012445 [Aphanomyces euteiches]|uniref:Uncharacterized protein n=1 Tax=Aphanomyces euteiches TaxID=100861 RepID=A0A6G0W978_9STRA|nr:hypothetical protein Ae201684_018173 [Aphanomyces euteiches]KAH9075955.1 hypothetical protein Ae201684P_012445 [Aphanomyces euteiches]